MVYHSTVLFMRDIMEKMELQDFGKMTDPWEVNEQGYRLRDLFEYCKQVGKKPAELDDEERDKFRAY